MTYEALLRENAELRQKIADYKELIEAIKSGHVDALVVSNPKGDQIYTLEGADEPYRMHLESMNEGAVTLSSDGAVLYCNKRFSEMAQSPMERIWGRALADFIEEGQKSRFYDIHRRALTEDHKAEFLMVSGASTIPVLLSIRAFSTGKDKAISVVLTDLTEQKSAEKKRIAYIEEIENKSAELQRQKELLETIVGNIPVMLTFYDASGRVHWLNEEAMRKIGLTLEEMRQTDLMSYCYPEPENRRQVLDYMQSAASGWKDITMRVRNGDVLESSWSNVRLSDGSFIGIGIDVTDRKIAEAQIKKYIAELEWRNRELKDFADASAHDLQEPLRKVQMFANFLLSQAAGELSEENRKYLNRMIDAAGRMRMLIRDLLTYSRVDINSGPFTRVDLNEILQEAVSDLEEAIQSSGGSVRAGDMPTVEADPTQMRQLFQNLISNALKYTEKGKRPIVEITSRNEIEEAVGKKRAFCEIRVKDNGIGFDEKYLDKIFQPFERLHTQEAYDSTGMGLSICRRITERHGGKITAKSMPGKGSTFIVTIPVNQSGRLELRQRAGRLVGDIPQKDLAAAPESVQKLVHELDVHRIELEMQNEELRESEMKAHELRQRWFEIYHLAPVGYLTLTGAGVIRQANLTACRMLGVSPDKIGASPPVRLAYYLEDGPDFYALDGGIQRALLSRKRQSCKLKLHTRRIGGKELYVKADFIPETDSATVLVILIDITAQKKAEMELDNLRKNLELDGKLRS